MDNEFGFLDEIAIEHDDRMQNLKKYYPFFKIRDQSLQQYKDGIYNNIDMGYLLMAILRLFIEENNFNDTGVTYRKFSDFITELLKRDYNLFLNDAENKELVGYIFDKIKNDGKPFYYDYYDPKEKKNKSSRIKLIESKILDREIYYYITSEAIEFYLDTKEIKDESKISIQQVLLTMMIESKNFKGGIEVVRRINNEVSKLMYRKNEILSILSYNVFEGMKAYDDFFNTGMRWFDEEQRLFEKNKQLIELAFEKLEGNGQDDSDRQEYIRDSEYIYTLDGELKKAISKHSELLKSCTDLKVKSDEIIKRATLNKLKMAFDFKNAFEKAQMRDDVTLLSYLMDPMLMLKLKKTFNLRSVDALLTYRPMEEEEGEEIQYQDETAYTTIDEIEDERISHNFLAIMGLLLKYLKDNSRFTLREFNLYLCDKLGSNILKNGDYYSFIIHLSQRNEYDMSELLSRKDTMFDNIITPIVDLEPDAAGLKFKMVPLPEDEIEISPLFKITNIIFERAEQVG